MSQVLLILGRLIIIFAGYAAASLAASAFLNLLVIGTLDFPAEDLPAAMHGSFMIAVPFLALFVAWFAFTPAAVAIVVAELAGKRDWLFHAIGGGIVAEINARQASCGLGLPDRFVRLAPPAYVIATVHRPD